MTGRSIACAAMLTIVFNTAPVLAADVDFERFMVSPSGAAGLSAAISSLGECDTRPVWSLSYDPDIDRDNPNHVHVGCQYHPDWEEGDNLYDKGVLAKFFELEGVLTLESLTQLP